MIVNPDDDDDDDVLSAGSVVKRLREEEEEEEEMHRVLSQGVLRQMAYVRSVVVGLSACEARLAASVCVVGRLTPGRGQRWVSTSAFNRAVERPKLQPDDQDQNPPSHPPSLAGTEPVYGADSSKLPVEAPEIDPLQDKSIGLVQRFKKTFKQYGKVMIPVHLLTSSVWFGTFYYAAMQ